MVGRGGRNGRNGRNGTLLVILALALVVAIVAAVLFFQQRRAREQRLDEAAAEAAQGYSEAWVAGDLSTAPLAGAEPTAVQEQYAALTAGLGGARPQVAEVRSVERTEDTATAQMAVTWPFGPDGWAYTAEVPLEPTAEGDDAAWGALYSPGAVHPDLVEGDTLQSLRTPAQRADVLGRDGAPIVTSSPVVDVGVQPSRATDPASLSATLGGILDVDAADLQQRITAAAPEAFVPVITLRDSDYDAVRDQLQPLPGTVFREATLPLAPTRAYARSLLGTVGAVTAEIVEESGGRLAAGDVAGVSGLQRRYDERLGGTAGVSVDRVRGEERTSLFAVEPQPGEPVQVTLDSRVQQAADAALATATGGNGNAALVAVDVATGDVLAVANTPITGENRALTGQYPPGSTFKTVSTLALLGTGLTPDEVVPCPPTATVDGRSFRNFEGSAIGDVDFRTDFAQSCNTAFVGLSSRLQPDSLQTAAAGVGIGGAWDVGVDAFTGDVPVTESAVDLAAATIGQGRDLASPLAMAQSTAAIARGSWLPPRLVVQPEPPAAPASTATADPAALGTVRDLMRQVVVDGTASALADVPGEPVHAKTGTAEYGGESPPRTHAWTVGFQGGVAFSVLVEDGASGGAVAVPVAEAFLRALQ